MSPSISGCCHWTTPGAASSLTFPSTKILPEVVGRAVPRRCARSSASISSSRSSERAPNLSRARTRAAWRRCNAPIKTSTNCWKLCTERFTVCARTSIDEELFDVIAGFEAQLQGEGASERRGVSRVRTGIAPWWIWRNISPSRRSSSSAGTTHHCILWHVTNRARTRWTGAQVTESRVSAPAPWTQVGVMQLA